MKEKIIKLEKIFWIFVIGCVLGYIVEMIVALVQEGHFESRQGLIYGPFAQVYGIGLVLYYIFFEKVKIRGLIKVFLISMLLGGTIEYICSFVQEKCFGTISWDYSNLPLNLHGRTSILHCIYWGIGGVLYIKYVLPFIKKMETKLSLKGVRVLTILLAVFMSVNIVISSIAAERQMRRNENIQAASSMDVFLDKYYPDEYMDNIYANKKIKV